MFYHLNITTMKTNINDIANEYRKTIKKNVKSLGLVDLLLWSIPSMISSLFFYFGI